MTDFWDRCWEEYEPERLSLDLLEDSEDERLLDRLDPDDDDELLLLLELLLLE